MPKVNYLKVINDFWRDVPYLDGYKSDYGILYFSLLDFINTNNWRETEIEYDRIINKTRIGKRMYLEARKWLLDNGVIMFKSGKGDYEKAKFWIKDEVQKRTATDTADSDSEVQGIVQKRTADYTADYTATDTADVPQLNKLINYETNKGINNKHLSEHEISKSEISSAIKNDNVFSFPFNPEEEKQDSEKAPQAGGAAAVEVVDKWKEGHGDGTLHKMLVEYYQNPLSQKYSPDTYKDFKAYWTAIIRVGINAGKEKWSVQESFTISQRLASWSNNEIKKHGNTNNWGKNRKDIPLAPIGTEPTNGRKFGKL